MQWRQKTEAETEFVEKLMEVMEVAAVCRTEEGRMREKGLYILSGSPIHFRKRSQRRDHEFQCRM